MLRSLERLEAHQFLQGKPETDQLQLNRYVWEFWNINSLVLALRDLPAPSLTMAIIRDPADAIQSFFVFGIKNGENVTILTDRDEKAHPLQNSMSRRPDRQMNERANRNWFPYRLIGIESILGEDIFGQEVVIGYRAEQRTGLVPYDVKGIRLTEIKDLEPAEMLWLMLTAERINLRYGKENHKLPELSYTGEMVARPYALASPEGTLVKTGTYQPLTLAPLTSIEVNQDSTAHQWDGERTNFNAWIEERYIHQVPETLLNLIGSGTNLLALEKEVGIYIKKEREWGFREKEESALTTFDPLVFGKEEDIRNDVVWHARHNQVTMMNRLAWKEFEETKDSVIDFWFKGIRARRQQLVEAAARLDFSTVSRAYMCPKGAGPAGGGEGKIDSWGFIPVDSPVNLAKRARLERTWGSKQTVWFDDKTIPHRNGRWKDWTTTCAVNGKKASLFVEMEPDNPTALAALLGIPETELPWQMQNWYTIEPYHGNQILRRLDPLEWCVKNPWRNLRFRVVVSFTRSGLNALRKQLELPRFTDVGYCTHCYNDATKAGCTKCGRKKVDDAEVHADEAQSRAS